MIQYTGSKLHDYEVKVYLTIRGARDENEALARAALMLDTLHPDFVGLSEVGGRDEVYELDEEDLVA